MMNLIKRYTNDIYQQNSLDSNYKTTNKSRNIFFKSIGLLDGEIKYISKHDII